MNKAITAIAAIGASFMIGFSAYASVYTRTEQETNWNMKYPVVTASAGEAINEDIQGYYDNLRYAFNQGRYYNCTGTYVVHYEDNDVLSISLYLAGYPYGANGNHVVNYDLVYDKHTGERIPLYNYVRATTKDLEYYMGSHTYSMNGRRLTYDMLQSRTIREVPENYFLEGGGYVCVVFRPYELAAGAMGATYIQLDPKYIEYLNRKNQW